MSTNPPSLHAHTGHDGAPPNPRSKLTLQAASGAAVDSLLARAGRRRRGTGVGAVSAAATAAAAASGTLPPPRASDVAGTCGAPALTADAARDAEGGRMMETDEALPAATTTATITTASDDDEEWEDAEEAGVCIVPAHGAAPAFGADAPLPQPPPVDVDPPPSVDPRTAQRAQAAAREVERFFRGIARITSRTGVLASLARGGAFDSAADAPTVCAAALSLLPADAAARLAPTASGVRLAGVRAIASAWAAAVSGAAWPPPPLPLAVARSCVSLPDEAEAALLAAAGRASATGEENAALLAAALRATGATARIVVALADPPPARAPPVATTGARRAAGTADAPTRKPPPPPKRPATGRAGGSGRKAAPRPDAPPPTTNKGDAELAAQLRMAKEATGAAATAASDAAIAAQRRRLAALADAAGVPLPAPPPQRQGAANPAAAPGAVWARDAAARAPASPWVAGAWVEVMVDCNADGALPPPPPPRTGRHRSPTPPQPSRWVHVDPVTGAVDAPELAPLPVRGARGARGRLPPPRIVAVSAGGAIDDVAPRYGVPPTRPPPARSPLADDCGVVGGDAGRAGAADCARATRRCRRCRRRRCRRHRCGRGRRHGPLPPPWTGFGGTPPWCWLGFWESIRVCPRAPLPPACTAANPFGGGRMWVTCSQSLGGGAGGAWCGKRRWRRPRSGCRYAAEKRRKKAKKTASSSRPGSASTAAGEDDDDDPGSLSEGEWTAVPVGGDGSTAPPPLTLALYGPLANRRRAPARRRHRPRARAQRVWHD